MKKAKKSVKKQSEVKLYIGRLEPAAGFKKVSIAPVAPMKLMFQENSVDEITVEHIFHLVPGPMRGAFMDECFRILKVGGKLTISVPYYSHMRAVQDFMHAWPPVCEASFLYFNKGWREANKIDYDLHCDFDFGYGYSAEQETASKNDETRNFYIKHYVNAVTDLIATLTKRDPNGSNSAK